MRLRISGYRLLDTQFVTDHLRQFGAIEINRQDYHGILKEALSHKGIFYGDVSADEEECVKRPFAINDPDVVDRMLHCGERWTGRKHPAPIYALCRLSEFYLGDIQERRALRRFFRRALIAGPGDNMEGAKSDRVHPPALQM